MLIALFAAILIISCGPSDEEIRLNQKAIDDAAHAVEKAELESKMRRQRLADSLVHYEKELKYLTSRMHLLYANKAALQVRYEHDKEPHLFRLQSTREKNIRQDIYDLQTLQANIESDSIKKEIAAENCRRCKSAM